MVKLLFKQASKFFVVNIALALSLVLGDRAVAATLFNLNFDGTLTGIDPLGTTATSQRVKGSFLLDANTANNSPFPIAGRYDGAIRDLNLTFVSIPDRNAVTFSTTDFPGRTNRVYVGARGTREELQFLFGNVAPVAPFFQPSSLGIIFSSSDLPLTTQLKEVLKPNVGIFNGEFKLVLSADRVETPNNSFSGSISITPTPVPEPENTFSLIFLLGLAYLCTTRIKDKSG